MYGLTCVCELFLLSFTVITKIKGWVLVPPPTIYLEKRCWDYLHTTTPKKSTKQVGFSEAKYHKLFHNYNAPIFSTPLGTRPGFVLNNRKQFVHVKFILSIPLCITFTKSIIMVFKCVVWKLSQFRQDATASPTASHWHSFFLIILKLNKKLKSTGSLPSGFQREEP